MTALETAKKIASLLDEKMARDVKILKVGDLTVLCQYFVIAHGTNSTQVKTLADFVEVEMDKEGQEWPLLHREGYNSSWILLDYGEVVTHVFYKDARDFYDLEHLWADGEEIPFATKEKEEDK